MDLLPDRVLHGILDNARFAPSGGNRQGTRIVIVRDRATREALVDLTASVAKKYAAQRAAGEVEELTHLEHWDGGPLQG